jgi:UDP-N-acetylmuramoylalanine--D-glutamate ligase
MIRATTFAGKTVAVFGLGSSGNATARALIEGGATVAAWDDGEAGRASAQKAGVPLVDLNTADWSGFAALVLAPGVPLTHPEPHWTVQKARAAGVEVIGDVELFFRERAAVMLDAVVVAITGTNGKSTTTALTAHILTCAGRDVQMGGNIGVPVLALEPFVPGRIYVLELSSFQIDLTPSLAPTVGVLLNITPDHLDRHGPTNGTDTALRNYAAIKERVVASADHAIVADEDEWCEAIVARLEARITDPPRLWGTRVASRRISAPAVFADGDKIVSSPLSDFEEELADLSGIATLRGRHNAQNAVTAAVAATFASASPDDVSQGLQQALRTYPGLPHRMEQVGTLQKPAGRILFINDSKATNADSTEKALASWDKDIFVILGGKPKEGGITSLAPYFPRIAKAYLIGQATEEFAATLEGNVPFERCDTLDKALAAATRDALASPGSEPVVLLSPACASYDQFRSFEHRGNEFRVMVQAMPGVVAGGVS